MPRRHFVWIVLLAGVSLGGYLLASCLTFRVGFPLDDAWIHQTYARNLAELGEWSFVPGKVSAGSTAPLWSILLAFGYVVGMGPYIWTYFLGWVGLIGMGIVGYSAVGIFAPERKQWRMWGAVVLVLEWHLVWAAGSGMETLLFALMVTLVLVWIAAGWERWFWLGALIGLCAWVRPDGVTLLAPAGMAILLAPGKGDRDWGARIRQAVVTGLGFSILFFPYLGFNQVLAGAWWPNTFFAKQAEYAILQEIFIGTRLLQQLSLPLVGVGVVLLPGSLFLAWRMWVEKRWGVLVGMVWWLGYAGLFAWRLPVIYQHGRYFMPAMPIFFLWGLAGLLMLMGGRPRGMVRRILMRAWGVTAGLVLGIFCFQGAQAYALDVAFIESEMVVTAKWVANNTASDALVAAHDIGALGFYGDRDILDLAGLVSPEVIPFIRDEKQLEKYLDDSQAEYFITLEGWYPKLEERGIILFRTDSNFAKTLGGTNMIVSKWLTLP